MTVHLNASTSPRVPDSRRAILEAIQLVRFENHRCRRRILRPRGIARERLARLRWRIAERACSSLGACGLSGGGDHMSEENSTFGTSTRANWRDPESYKHFLELDRQGWAWEWLKRNLDFLAPVDKLLCKEPASI